MSERQKTAGLIGFPLGHSVSPPMHQAAFEYLGLPWRYFSWETPPAQLPARIADLRSADIAGANVTVPHKAAVIPFLDQVDPEAASIGAVNTIVNREGSLSGYNTDVTGFLRALREDGGFDPSATDAFVLGAGGAARAVLFALVRAGAKSITIANRDIVRAARLAEAASPANADIRVVPWLPGELVAAARRSQLIVNTTTVGMQGGPAPGESPLPPEGLRRDQMVFDLVYNPSETALATMARAAGARALTGLPMLVYQGADAFALWTGLPAPVEVMRTAAEAALKGD